MNNRKEELIKEYDHIIQQMDELKSKKSAIEDEYKEIISQHKLGEIVKWKETNRVKNVGATWHPVLKQLPDKECSAVVTGIRLWTGITLESSTVEYTLCYIKKDGKVGLNHAYVPKDAVWTGEIHEDYKSIS